MMARFKPSVFLAFIYVFVQAAKRVDSGQCWWSECQPSNWVVQHCPPDAVGDGRGNCRQDGRSTRFIRCHPVTPIATEEDFVLDDCWWTGCGKEEICDEASSRFQCCLKRGPDGRIIFETPTSVDTKTCRWSSCKSMNWAMRGCPKETVETDSDSCLNETSPAQKYRCCRDSDGEKGASCWLATCKSKQAEWRGRVENSISVDQMECDGGDGTRHQ